MKGKFFMVLIVDFDAAEIVPGDAGYRADEIISQVLEIEGMKQVVIAGSPHSREE